MRVHSHTTNESDERLPNIEQSSQAPKYLVGGLNVPKFPFVT
jgi:hypothetical protein